MWGQHHRANLKPEGRLPQHHVAPCTPPPGALRAAAAQQVCAAHGRLTQGSGRHFSQLVAVDVMAAGRNTSAQQSWVQQQRTKCMLLFRIGSHVYKDAVCSTRMVSMQGLMKIVVRSRDHAGHKLQQHRHIFGLGRDVRLLRQCS